MNQIGNIRHSSFHQVEELEKTYSINKDPEILEIIYYLLFYIISNTPWDTKSILRRIEIYDELKKSHIITDYFDGIKFSKINDLSQLIYKYPEELKYRKQRGIEFYNAGNDLVKIQEQESTFFKIDLDFLIDKFVKNYKNRFFLLPETEYNYRKCKEDLEIYCKSIKDDGEAYFILGMAKILLKENPEFELENAFKLRYMKAIPYYHYFVGKIIKDNNGKYHKIND